MAICSKCGSQLPDGAKFCLNCGAQSSGSPENSQSYQAGNSKRETVFEGEIHKCPSCGEVLGAFVTTCPSCGYEIRGGKSSASLHEFSMSLANAASDEQRTSLIRNFPVPNTKEDIFEFLILASSNITGNTEQNICDAWAVKFRQVEQKLSSLLLPMQTKQNSTSCTSRQRKSSPVTNMLKQLKSRKFSCKDK